MTMRRALFAFLVVLAWAPPPARAEVAVQSYALPSGGGFPHDVAVGSDDIIRVKASARTSLFIDNSLYTITKSVRTEMPLRSYRV